LVHPLNSVILHLQNIRPDYLSSAVIGESEVWDVELGLNPGEGIIVWGPSGQGKSTFLRILYGLETRYRGRLLVDGTSPPSNSYLFWPTIRSEEVAFVTQDFGLFGEISGWANLRLLPSLAREVDRPQIEQWASQLGIEALLERSPATWSQGQRQRFALLRALASPFSWLLLDEPISHLDPEAAERTLDLMISVCKERGAGWILAQQTAESPIPVDRIFKV